jgi:pyrimidine-nucleoside phosphorylase
VRHVTAPQDGFVRSLGAIAIGTAALHLGAGRQAKEDSIDHAVGVRCRKKRGDEVSAGEPIAEVHARDDGSADDAVERVLAAYTFGTEPPPRRPIVLETIV